MLACSPELAHLTSTALFSSMLHEKLLYQEAHTTIRLLPSAVSKCVLTVHVLRVHMYTYIIHVGSYTQTQGTWYQPIQRTNGDSYDQARRAYGSRC